MKNFSKSLLTVITFFFSSFVSMANGAKAEGENWVSPDKTLTLRMVASDKTPNNPPLISLVAEANGKTVPISESAIVASPIRREYAGTSWLWDTRPRWSGNRFAIFEANDSAPAELGIIDVERSIMLLNTTFESLVDAPAGDKWAAIRYRPIARNQERLHGGETDTLFVINLPDVVTAAKAMPVAEQKVFGHLKSIVLPGVALAHPLWNADASKILVGIWNWKTRQAEALSFDPVTMKSQGSVNMNLAVPDAVAYSPWIDADFEPKVIQALNHSGL